MMEHIDIDSQIGDFKQYLDSTDRIVLSAPFGDGKTTFLRELQQDDRLVGYHFLTVYPVNYVVSENEDIFEYIKRDLLVQLQEQHLLDNIDLDALISSVASYDLFREALSFLLSFVPYGALCDKILKKCEEIKQKYDEKKENFKKYDLSFRHQRGGLYENDGYTQIIRSALNYLKNRPVMETSDGEIVDTAKKPVLVIEDLDRLDPAHLFRILNVISAHIDETGYHAENNANKFGFSKIVLVMDYNATRHLFHHFYGEKANFDGYMSKFLTVEPFCFSITDVAREQFANNVHRFIGCEDITKDLMSFNNHLASLSLRDIARLSDFKYDDRLQGGSVLVVGTKFSLDLPLFRLLIFMIEMGMTKEEILKDLGMMNENRLQHYLSLIHPALVTFTRNRALGYKTYQEHYSVDYELDDDGVIVKIFVHRAASWTTANELQLAQNFETQLQRALPIFANQLNLAGLNDVRRN